MTRRTYGRHGTDAWRKRHERRFHRFLPVPSPLTVVVFLRVPSTVERVVLVLMPDNPLDPAAQNPGEQHVASPGVVDVARMNGQVYSQLDPVAQMGNFAFVEGNKKGNDDCKRQDVFSEDELDDEAMRASNVYVSAPENRVLLNYGSSDVLERFEAQYRGGYLRGAKLKSVEELPPSWKRSVQRRAHQDKELDERKGDARTGEALLGQAIDSALDSLGIRSAERKQGVKEQISVYLGAYEKYVSKDRYEREGGSFPAPLPS